MVRTNADLKKYGIEIPGAAPLPVARVRQVILLRRLAVQEAAARMLAVGTEQSVERHREATRLYDEARRAFQTATGVEVA